MDFVSSIDLHPRPPRRSRRELDKQHEVEQGNDFHVDDVALSVLCSFLDMEVFHCYWIPLLWGFLSVIDNDDEGIRRAHIMELFSFYGNINEG